MKKLWIDFFKGAGLFIIGTLVLASLRFVFFTYLELEVFDGSDVPNEYRFIALVVMLGLMVLLAILTMIKPARAINIEKDRRITQWGITGVRPEDQEIDTRKKE